MCGDRVNGMCGDGVGNEDRPFQHSQTIYTSVQQNSVTTGHALTGTKSKNQRHQLFVALPTCFDNLSTFHPFPLPQFCSFLPPPSLVFLMLFYHATVADLKLRMMSIMTMVSILTVQDGAPAVK